MPRDADDEWAGLPARFVSGDPHALEEMFRLWSPLVHTIALRTLRNSADAQDVTQQVFVSAWRGRHRYNRGRGTLPAWLVGITRHRVADALASRSRELRDRDVLGMAGPQTSAAEADAWADRLLLIYELERLGDPKATILRMAFLEGRTHSEISHHLGLPLGTVKSHVRRGLTLLKDRLTEVDHDTPD